MKWKECMKHDKKLQGHISSTFLCSTTPQFTLKKIRNYLHAYARPFRSGYKSGGTALQAVCQLEVMRKDMFLRPIFVPCFETDWSLESRALHSARV